MPCYHPLGGWYARKRNENGKRPVVFSLANGDERRPVAVPCGICIGCKLERGRQWAVRCMHEAKLHDSNLFVTLTYDDANMPADGSLVPGRFVDFMKRLRWHADGVVRFFHCGEYGETTGRPHHHAILFNVAFPDARYYKASGSYKLYTSRCLEDMWRHGLVTFGEASFETAAYIARYVLKKVTGPAAASHYGTRVPEYLTMSRRPGIGRGFVEKFRQEIYREDSVIVRGSKCKPPRFYDAWEEKVAPAVLAKVKARRRLAAQDYDKILRCYEREDVKVASMGILPRRTI